MDNEKARAHLVYDILRDEQGIQDPVVLDALNTVPREAFVPEEEKLLAYENHPLPIGEGQTISQPYIVAFMTEAAKLNKNSKVLEVGTGCGYQAAILGEVCKAVFSQEIIPSLANSAKKRFQQLGYKNISVKHADGYHGWQEEAPFDAILVTACAQEIPKPLIEQLKLNGRLIIPVQSEIYQSLLRVTKLDNGELNIENLLPVAFVPLTRNE